MGHLGLAVHVLEVDLLGGLLGLGLSCHCRGARGTIGVGDKGGQRGRSVGVATLLTTLVADKALTLNIICVRYMIILCESHIVIV